MPINSWNIAENAFNSTPWPHDTFVTVTAQQAAAMQAAQNLQTDLSIIDELTTTMVNKYKSKVKEVDPNAILQDIYSYKNLSLRKTDSINYEKSNKLIDKPFVFTTNYALIGIEIEVENITNNTPLQAYWSAKGDGSLRNNGIELVSVPLQVKQIQYAMEHAWDTLYKHNKPDFSNRTSIHVHLNCRDMTKKQLEILCLLYAIFEKHFYQFAGTKRLSSIFCVPWFRTNIVTNLRKVIYDHSPMWHKYSGLNLIPLWDNNGQRAFGTIEFRHLNGTSNLQEIYTWIDQILCLRKAALTLDYDEFIQNVRNMNTTSSYMEMYTHVFGKYCTLTNKNDFEECVSNLKREHFPNDYLNTIKKSDTSIYWSECNKLGLRG